MAEPLQGEIWWVNFDPVVGAEIQKTRPGVVVSRGAESRLGIRLVVPLTTWRSSFERHRSKVRVVATPQNGLHADSAADVMQCRGVSIRRFQSQIGSVDEVAFDRIAIAFRFAMARNR